jgi:hypothetical protein
MAFNEARRETLRKLVGSMSNDPAGISDAVLPDS